MLPQKELHRSFQVAFVLPAERLQRKTLSGSSSGHQWPDFGPREDTGVGEQAGHGPRPPNVSLIKGLMASIRWYLGYLRG